MLDGGDKEWLEIKERFKLIDVVLSKLPKELELKIRRLIIQAFIDEWV